MRGLIWFRDDLRISDNTALYHAAKRCEDGIIGFYFIDEKLWQEHQVAACRVEFILRGLKELRKQLEVLNIPLIIKIGSGTKTLSHVLVDQIDRLKISALFFNKQYEVNESKRDQVVTAYLNSKKIDVFNFDDQAIVKPGIIVTQQGECYKVFTAYKHAWLRYIREKGCQTFKKPIKQNNIAIEVDPIPDFLESFASNISPNLWPAGEKRALKKLNQFLEENIYQYDKQRDFPATNSTSQLSPYLSAGMISARVCFTSALNANQQELDSGNKGVLTWINELIWRDFYKDILVAVPRVSMNKPFKLETEALSWRYNEAHYQAWTHGQTGFPIIDAGMRQLNTTGWMHNRLRMIVAMFFTKNLFFDWRMGEAYFMQHLIDGDLSANNGGWQWCASTGTDAAPYFRIFNPIRQSERFDPMGKFIRQFCPELVSLNNKQIHSPPPMKNYPAPIVNLDVTRKQAIAAFRAL